MKEDAFNENYDINITSMNNLIVSIELTVI